MGLDRLQKRPKLFRVPLQFQLHSDRTSIAGNAERARQPCGRRALGKCQARRTRLMGSDPERGRPSADRHAGRTARLRRGVASRRGGHRREERPASVCGSPESLRFCHSGSPLDRAWRRSNESDSVKGCGESQGSCERRRDHRHRPHHRGRADVHSQL